jgi:hypothetical protein
LFNFRQFHSYKSMSRQVKDKDMKKRRRNFVREVGGGELISKDGRNGYFFPDKREFIPPHDLGYNRLIGGFYSLSEFPDVEDELAEVMRKWAAGDPEIPRLSDEERQKAWDEAMLDQHFL